MSNHVRLEQIRNAVKEIGLGAIMHGNKVTIADDVSLVMGEAITYEQIVEALNTINVESERSKTMEIDLDTLIVNVDRQSRINETEADDIDTGAEDGSGEIQVRAASVTPITARSFIFNSVSIEVGGQRLQWAENSITAEAAEMLARDYLESLQTDDDYDENPCVVGFIGG